MFLRLDYCDEHKTYRSGETQKLFRNYEAGYKSRDEENKKLRDALDQIIEIAEDHYSEIESDGSYGCIAGIAKVALRIGE